MNVADRVARIRYLVVAFNRHDVAGVAEYLADTVAWNRGDGSSVQGWNNLALRLRELFAAFPDASLTPTHILAVEPDHVLVEWSLEGTHTNGRPVRIIGADLLGFNAAGEIESDDARIDTAALLAQIGAPLRPPPEASQLNVLAERYTAAWCSGDASRVADAFAVDGWLRVNAAPPAVGRGAIAEVAQSFMTAFPDMKVLLDGLLIHGERAVYRWTLVGTNTGPGGMGQAVRIGGFEVWQISDDGLIVESRGYFDSAAYQSQLVRGADNAS